MLDREPRRVLITGDLHGNSAWAIKHVLTTALRSKAELILQVGDFGVWPGSSGARFLDHVDRESGATGVPWHFIDGNHEDFEQLLAYPIGPDGRRVVRPNLLHLPRGFRWSWGGRSFLALGGAGSIDRDLRMPGVSWWPQETITPADVALCVEPGAVDVLIAHDAPAGVRLRSDWGAPPADILADIEESRERLQDVVDHCRPRLLIHGHWHVAQRTTLKRLDGTAYEVISLAADGQESGHCALLDVAVLATSADPADAVSMVH